MDGASRAIHPASTLRGDPSTRHNPRAFMYRFDYGLARTVHGAWTSFVRSGVPSHPDLPTWPAYEPTRRATMLLDLEQRLVEVPDADERRLWDGVRVD